MPTVVRIPAPMLPLTRNERQVQVRASSVQACIQELDQRFPGFRERLCDENGQVKPFVSIFVNGEDIETLHLLNTQLVDGDEVTIVPAIAGGVDRTSDINS